MVRICRQLGCQRLAFGRCRYCCRQCQDQEGGHTAGCERRQEDPAACTYARRTFLEFLPIPDHWPSEARNVILGSRTNYWAKVMAWAISVAIDNLQGQERQEFIRDALALFNPDRTTVAVEGAFEVTLCLLGCLPRFVAKTATAATANPLSKRSADSHHAAPVSTSSAGSQDLARLLFPRVRLAAKTLVSLLPTCIGCSARSGSQPWRFHKPSSPSPPSKPVAHLATD